MNEKKIIDLCPDGKYRWAYNFNLYTNLMYLRRLWRVALRVVVCVWLFVMTVLIASYGFVLNGVLSVSGSILFATAIALACISLVYYIWAAIGGGRYCILFELDDRGIYNIHLPRQYTQTQIQSYIEQFIAGDSDGSQITYAAELSKKTICSDFRAISGINANEKRRIIKLYGPFAKNKIFTKGADFELVLGTISGNSSPQAKRRIKMLERYDYI